MKLVWVGLSFFVAVLSLGAATLVVGDIRWTTKKDVYFRLHVDEVMGIKVNDVVRVDGFPFGKVTQVELAESLPDAQPSGVYLRCRIDSPITLYPDHSITVEGFALIGGAYVAVRRGSSVAGGGISVAKGTHDSYKTALKGKVDLGLMKTGSDFLNRHDRNIAQILDNIKDVTSNLIDITRDFKEGRGTIPKTVEKAGLDLQAALEGVRADLKTLVDNANRVVTNVNGVVDNINRAVDAARESVEHINRGEGTVGKLIRSEELYANLNKVIEEIRDTVKSIKESKGVFGAVMHDEKMRDDVTGAIVEVRSAAESLNKVIKSIENGWIPRFVQDEEVPSKIKSGLEGLDKTLGRAGRSVAYLHAGHNSFSDTDSSVSRVNIVFWPSDDKYLLFGGALMHYDDGGEIKTDENLKATPDTMDHFGIEVQLAYRIPIAKPLTFRAGMIEGKPGGAIDFEWSDWGIFEHPMKLTFEARDAYRSVDNEDIDENLDGLLYRAQLKTPIFPRGLGWFGNVLASLKLVAGGSRLFQPKGREELFVGLSLEYEEEDIRTILGLISTSR
jgi:phospholipid/cholesterol/gamma-HCH transport system substrate-binding protein